MFTIGSFNPYNMSATFGITSFGNDAFTQLLLHFDTLLDSSGQQQTVQLHVNNTHIQTATAEFSGAMSSPPSIDEFATVTATSSLDTLSGDFTIECWFNLNNVTQLQSIFAYLGTVGGQFTMGTFVSTGGYNGTGQVRMSYFLTSSTGSSFDLVVGNTPSGAGSINIAANTWYHFALVRSGNNFNGYINGALDFSFTSSANLRSTATVPLTVGGWVDGSQFLSGFIDEFRYSNNARWTAPFTPAASAYTSDANTMLLLHFDLPLEVDSSQNNLAVSLTGTAYNEVLVSKFGGAMDCSSATSQLASVSASPALNTSTGDFTFDCWFNLKAVTSLQPILAFLGTGGTGQYTMGTFVSTGSYNGTGQVRMSYFLTSSAGTSFDLVSGDHPAGAGSTNIAANTWYHFAFVRNGSNFSGYINGVLDFSFTSSSNLRTTSTLPLLAGGWTDGSLNFNGYMDEFRYSNVARWTAPFTPPVVPYA